MISMGAAVGVKSVGEGVVLLLPFLLFRLVVLLVLWAGERGRVAVCGER